MNVKNSILGALIFIVAAFVGYWGTGFFVNEPQNYVGDVVELSANGVPIRMIRVMGGNLLMGATNEQQSKVPDELPVHNVTVNSFLIGETEVTQELWCAVMGSNPSNFVGDVKLPVENVSYIDCQRFIEKLNQITGQEFRLPTEEEWEYAARGGSESVKKTMYSGGSDVEEVAWYRGNSGNDHLDHHADVTNYKLEENNNRTHPVATKRNNELGIFDMSGNVMEWCNDLYGHYRKSGEKEVLGADNQNYVIRGGSWASLSKVCRTSARNKCGASKKDKTIGFRLAMSKFALKGSSSLGSN